ncbi:uncharacterized protein LOC110444211 [Mizuhopecten yessoensis]|uniref:uncharacterized protein LOC110444211 n=1 Tax=Mizuhopecten yessoensis TaxID=6573 RepID=UPI000B45874C|nr:uncharacterized protein LOC110444211 [Mizuhopecten yessoensis]
MTMDESLKWFPIVILLFIVQFRLVNNVAQTKTKALRNFDRYDDKKYYEDNIKLANYDRRKRSPSRNLDDEEIDSVSDNLRKKEAKQKRHQKKHRKGKKEKDDDDKVKEKKLSKAMTSEVERELGLHGDAVGNPCVASPCAHGGTCTWNREGQPGFRCDCRLGFRGKRCERGKDS